MSDALSSHLSYFYSCILSFNCVPMVFKTSIATNYRPIIVSSIFSKFFELIVYPRDIWICNNQFGFMSAFGVYNGTSLLNDLMCNSKYTGSNIFICSLDADKCFMTLYGTTVYFINYIMFYLMYIADSYANGVLI